MDEKIERLWKIKTYALLLKNNRESSHSGEAILIQAEIDYLVDEFQTGFGDSLSSGQLEKAKEDFDFFLTLIDSALNHLNAKGEEKT